MVKPSLTQEADEIGRVWEISEIVAISGQDWVHHRDQA